MSTRYRIVKRLFVVITIAAALFIGIPVIVARFWSIESIVDSVENKNVPEEEKLDLLLLAGSRVIPEIHARLRSNRDPDSGYLVLALVTLSDEGSCKVLKELVLSESASLTLRQDAASGLMALCPNSIDPKAPGLQEIIQNASVMRPLNRTRFQSILGFWGM